MQRSTAKAGNLNYNEIHEEEDEEGTVKINIYTRMYVCMFGQKYCENPKDGLTMGI